MSCCPGAAPPLGAVGDASISYGQDSSPLRGENVDCYAKNSPNPTGLMDDATGNVPNRIKNTSVTVDCSATVNETFSLGNAENTVTADHWVLTVDGVESSGFDGVSFTSSGETATFSGTFTAADLGKKLTIMVSVYDSDDVEIDSRSYTFSPSLCSSSDAVKLSSPLPGAIVNSKFGPRVHPITGVVKAHTGIDMKFADRSVADVLAAADGEVILAQSTTGGYGNSVHVKHLNGAGTHVCTTTYNHLAKIYVTVGQKVSSGQRIGLEGTTGASTGNHLHFEVKLPNGTYVDPLPYLDGTITAADKTLANGDADQSSLHTSTNTNTQLTTDNVKAKDSSCNMGSGYAAAEPGVPTPTPVDPSTDPFEQAWAYTMTREVGAFWNTTPETSPDDPDVAAGKIETADQRRRVGYTSTSGDKGGTTKFGVAQNANRNIDVPKLNYADAKQTGYNNYWLANSTDKPNLIAIMMFDISYLHGAGGARKILSRSGADLEATDQLPECAKIRDAQITYFKNIVANNPAQSKFLNGWTNRANALYNFVAGLA